MCIMINGSTNCTISTKPIEKNHFLIDEWRKINKINYFKKIKKKDLMF
jgi:hypothetical protein